MFALAIHGGAGELPASRVPAERVEEMRRDLDAALASGLAVLERGGGALDAVVAAVALLEDSLVFNAGRGAVLREDGSARLDASVMSGSGARAGAVCLVRRAKNPVQLARAVLERGREVMLAGEDADRLAAELGLETRESEYFVLDYRRDQLERMRARGATALDHDAAASTPEQGQTVGAVALDMQGHVAAATSTGGMTNASPGRVGDSPIIGAGTWASDETCAVSATGAGEYFIRAAFAHEVHARLGLGRQSLDQATRAALGRVVALGGRGGCVALDRAGHVVAPFTTGAMPRAWQSGSGERRVLVLEPSA